MRYAWPLTAGILMLLLCACPQKKEAEGGPGGGAGGGGGAPSGPPPVSVVVQPVEMRDYSPALDLSGELRASQRATLTAEVSGKITAIAARVGQSHSASAGALISIDPSDYKAQLELAQGNLMAAQVALDEARSGPREQEIAGQQALVDQAQAALNEARDNLSRKQQLFDSGVISEQELVSARTRVETAQAALNSQLEVLDRLKEGTRKEQIQAAEARVKSARSSVELASLNLEKTTISPAFDAKVTRLMVEVGQFVGPGTPLVEIVSDGPGEAWFNVAEGDVSRIKPGDSVEIRSDALADTVVTGEVISISPAADAGTRQFPVRVAVNDERLLPGMALRGRILLGQPKSTLMISQDAAYESKLGLVVYRMTPPGPDDKPMAEGMPPLPSFETVPVKTGERIDGLAVIIEGELKAGDMLVTRGKEGLYPGAKIIPTNLQGGGPGGEAPAAGGAPAGGAEAGADAGAEGAPAAPGAEGENAAGEAGSSGK
ncbi:efflux RND transporter periplasmic adaptor subunit [bacterium]|nr:efflux RND transporter periplasmic adaptor subunit [bacterium]